MVGVGRGPVARHGVAVVHEVGPPAAARQAVEAAPDRLHHARRERRGRRAQHRAPPRRARASSRSLRFIQARTRGSRRVVGSPAPPWADCCPASARNRLVCAGSSPVPYGWAQTSGGSRATSAGPGWWTASASAAMVTESTAVPRCVVTRPGQTSWMSRFAAPRERRGRRRPGGAGVRSRPSPTARSCTRCGPASRRGRR